MFWKKMVLLLVAAVAVWWWQGQGERAHDGSKSQAQQQLTEALRTVKEALQTDVGGAAGARQGDSAIAQAYAQRRSDVLVSGQGEVVKTLRDDDQGSRHQRFILQLANGQTLLVAHNIDLAPRLADLAVGDQVAFKGEYVYNSKGGVLHWTHHDPEGKHEGGWLQYRGRYYQ